jgi:hypothetical protein
VLFFIAFFFARGPENFTAFAAFVDIVAAAVPDLAAAAFAAAGALAPCITAAMARFVFTWHGRITGLGLLLGLFAFARLRILHLLLTLARLEAAHGLFLLTHFAFGHHITRLFTPKFAHYFHLIRISVI